MKNFIRQEQKEDEITGRNEERKSESYQDIRRRVKNSPKLVRHSNLKMVIVITRSNILCISNANEFYTFILKDTNLRMSKGGFSEKVIKNFTFL